MRRSENMRRIQSKDTQPELAIRRLVHSLGYRYRLHSRDLPGRPDLVFPSRRKVIFVHGCFWHQHDACSESHIPFSHISYWKPKLLKNKARDSANLVRLRKEGWKCLVVWECQMADLMRLQARIQRFLK
jgi:DNA mismatch endonuclease (patch repair protein)